MNYNSALHVSRRAETSPNTPAVIFEGRTWSYSSLDEAVSATAAVLGAYGVGRGDRVAILGLNSDEYVIACLAVARVGGTSVLLNYRLTLDELKYLVSDSEPVAILVDEDFAGLLDDLVRVTSDVRLAALLFSPEDSSRTLKAMRSAHVGTVVDDAHVGPDDLDRILYTSGTTSRPKGVMLSFGNATWNVLTQMLEGCCAADERTLVFAPLYHIGAQELPGMRVLAAGGTMVVMRRFDAPTVLEMVQEHRITGMVMVSTMIHIMHDLPNRLDFDTSSVRWLVFGQVPENMLDEIRAIFPNAALRNSYGMTECCSTATIIDDANQRIRPLSPGKVVSTLDMKIVDDDDREVERGQVGEIVLRGPKVMLGYWRLPNETAEALKGGWLHTGDMGMQDEAGFLYVVDRKKDMIRTGGENVSSQEVERVIYEMGTVAEVAAVGVPDDKWGESIKVVIVPRPGESIEAADVIAHCRRHLAAFKAPKLVEFRAELPRNPSGKILKRELRG
jgi:acyl-CoA synthetase (AMP-forming)/AMP-acid ligase II